MTGSSLEGIKLDEFRASPEKAIGIFQKCEELLKHKEVRAQDTARREYRKIQDSWTKIEAETDKQLQNNLDESFSEVN